MNYGQYQARSEYFMLIILLFEFYYPTQMDTAGDSLYCSQVVHCFIKPCCTLCFYHASWYGHRGAPSGKLWPNIGIFCTLGLALENIHNSPGYKVIGEVNYK